MTLNLLQAVGIVASAWLVVRLVQIQADQTARHCRCHRCRQRVVR